MRTFGWTKAQGSDVGANREDAHAIVGAGLCGLAAAAALKRHGIPFIVFEAADDLGGNWYHGVYEGVRLISTPRTTELPDFPMPESYPTFPDRHQMLAYLREYAHEHGLRSHIRFDTRVERIRPVTRGNPDDRWTVETEHGESITFAGVVVANGHHWDKRYPRYRGHLDIELLHAKDYKHPDQLEGRRVLVIGGGNSACDIAVEAARVGKTAHISMRRGYWFMPRMFYGRPTLELLNPWVPAAVQRRLFQAALRLKYGDYRDYGLQRPDHRVFERHPTITDALIPALAEGKVIAHPDIERWDGNEVRFVDGSREQFDLVVAATGYELSFPFFDDDLIAWDGDMPQLVGGMSPEFANLYIFGLGQARYGGGPLAGRGAEALASAIRVQRRLDRPLGRVLWDLGARPPKTFIIDPHRAMRMIDFGRDFVLPALPRIDASLRRISPLSFGGKRSHAI